MKKYMRTIAAMQAAAILFTSTAFAEELFDNSMMTADAAVEMTAEEAPAAADDAQQDAELSEEDEAADPEDAVLFEDAEEIGEEAFDDGESVDADAAIGVYDSLDDAGLDLIESVDFVAAPPMGMLGASNDITPSEYKTVQKYYKSVYENFLEVIGVADPALKPLIPFLRLLAGATIFREGPTEDNTGEIIKEKLNEISTQITALEDNLKAHTYNVVSLAHIGDKYNTVKDKAKTINTLMEDIMGTGSKSYEQKRREIADLYDTAEFVSLTSAMNGATDCFYSSLNNIFEKKNIFDAAYDRACEEVMFSREAIDISLPYIMYEYSIYAAAYSTMSEVYDAYEEVYGADTLTATRKLMTERLFGGDLNGRIYQKSILGLIADYANRDKYVFVNKSNSTKIRVDSTLLYVIDIGKTQKIELFSQHMPTPDYVKTNPLNNDHVKALTEYCNKKGVSLWDFLFNNMGFDPAVMFNGKITTPEELRNNILARMCFPVTPMRPSGWAVNLNVDHSSNVYLGSKYTNANIDNDNKYYPGIYGSGYEVNWYYINGAKMTGKDHSVERKLICRYSKSDGEDVGERTECDCHFVFFQPSSVPAPTPAPTPDIPAPEPEVKPAEELPDIACNVTWYDEAGNKYVRDGQSGLVTVYDADGNVIGTFQY